MPLHEHDPGEHHRSPGELRGAEQLAEERLRRHSLEAESGVRQGLDLLFSIERDDASR